MVVTRYVIGNSSGDFWDSDIDAPLDKYGSYGEKITIKIGIQFSSPPIGNVFFDAMMFSNTSVLDGLAHPNNGQSPMAFVVNVDGMANSTNRAFNINGNNNSNIIGSATLTKTSSTNFIINHTFILGEDVNDWMHKTIETELDNTEAYSSKGNFTNIYDSNKFYGVYIYNSAENVTDSLSLSFNYFDKTNYGTPQFEILDYKIYQSGVETNILSDGINNEVRVYFIDTFSDFQSMSLTMLRQGQVSEISPREELFDVKVYNSLSTATDGYGLYSSVNIPFTDIEAMGDYKLIPTFKGTSGSGNSKSYLDSSSGDRDYTPCEPFIDVYFKPYLNTYRTSKIHVAPYERMALEIHVWQDKKTTTIGNGYYGCLSDQGFYQPIFLNTFQNCSIDWFDGTKITFYKQIFGGYVSDYANAEYEYETVFGNIKHIFRIFFRVTEDYVGQIHNLDFIMNTTLYDMYTDLDGSPSRALTVKHTIKLPITINAREWENDVVSPNITDMIMRDDDGALIDNSGICNGSSYIQVISESATNYEAQALYNLGANIYEEDDIGSIHTYPYFALKNAANIFDLEDDYSTSGDNKFKTNLGLNADKIIVIGCQM